MVSGSPRGKSRALDFGGHPDVLRNDRRYFSHRYVLIAQRVRIAWFAEIRMYHARGMQGRFALDQT